MPTLELEFDNAHFLQSLLGHDLGRLKALEKKLAVQIISRDAWVKITGDPDPLELASSVFSQLESVRRQGMDVTPTMFDYIVENVAQGKGDAPLKELLNARLLGGPRKPPIMAKTKGQLDYLRALQKSTVTFGVGPAGTGKTYLAMAQAISCLKAKEVGRIVLTRPAVEAGEALGFLPGDFKEKVFPYLRPLYDALYDMLDPNEVEKYIERGMIEIAPLAYMRGRTLQKAYIILDEAQNTTKEQMFMFLTRIGLESRCAITGDPSQIDLRRGIPSGLVESLQALRDVEDIAIVHLDETDVVRHPVVASIIQAYQRHRAKDDQPGAATNHHV